MIKHSKMTRNTMVRVGDRSIPCTVVSTPNDGAILVKLVSDDPKLYGIKLYTNSIE